MVIPLCYLIVSSLVVYGVQKRLASFQKDLIFILLNSHFFDYADLLQCIIDEFRNQNWDFTV